MSSATRARAAVARMPWPLAVVLIFALSRAVSTAILCSTALHQPVGPWGGPSPSCLSFVNIWDAQWYQRIFEHGYPNAVPRAADGAARENTWAFMPLFPMLVKAVSLLTGGGWMPAAVITATSAGLAAALGMALLFRRLVGPEAALWATAAVLFSPMGALFQIPYAEGLSVFLLALVLYCLSARRWVAAMPLIALAGLTRPTAAPMALTVVIVAAYWFSARRRAELGSGEALGILGVVVTAAATAVAWPLLAWLGTGEATAYTETESVWRGGDLVLFKPWAERAHLLFGSGWWAGLLGAAAVVVGILGSRSLRATGMAVWGWCLSYVLYLAAVFNPQTSTFRILLPLFPLAALLVIAGDPTRVWSGLPVGAGGRGPSRGGPAAGGRDLLVLRLALILAGISLQIVWVYWLWRWTPLPGGGDYPP